MGKHQFGGSWTDEKLEALKEYLSKYRLIFSQNSRARAFTTIYVDAFAGTGDRTDSSDDASPNLPLIDDASEPDREEYKSGSARIALQLDSPFDKYIFVEKSQARASELESMISRDFHGLRDRCQVERRDGNDFLQEWCRTTNWDKNRAVVFLDPYGMSVEWETIKAIAQTKAIDLWILFPHGTGVNRLLTRSGAPNPAWEQRLTRIFGTQDWKSHFYRESAQQDLFGAPSQLTKDADFEKIGQFFLDRLRTIFHGVANEAKPLLNSKRNPMYLLCFAAGNQKGASIAVKIANHLLRHDLN